MKTHIIIIFFLLASIAGLSQQEVQGSKKIPVNLTTILKLAGANNLTIKQYELQYDLSLAQIDKAKEWFLPIISVGPTMHYLSGAVMQTNGSILNDATQKELWLGGGIVGTLDFKNGIYTVMAKKQQSVAVKFENQAQRNNIILEAISDYYDLMVAQFNYSQLFNLLSQSDTLTQQIKVQVDAGIRYQSEYLLAQSNYNHIYFELSDAEVQMRKKSDALLSILNIDTNALLISSDTGIAPIAIIKGSADTGLTTQYIQNRPEYKSMQAELNSVQAEKKSTTVGLLMPKLEVATPDAMLGTFGEPYYNSYRLDAGLLWDIPIGRILYKGDLKIYNAEINMEQNNMQKFGNIVHQQIADARAQIELSLEQIRFSKKSLEQSNKALTQSIERERIGTVLPFEVFQTEQFYVQAENDYLKAVSDYNKAQYQLYVAMGNNL
ncbi:MAG TPA: TolC family protein [Bacteroidia bacterium]|nr:TolC family protein [Bacteroidia bacterium]